MENWGGKQTAIKLMILEHYSTMYGRALKNKFHLIYVDCFAGDGKVETKAGETFTGSPLRIMELDMFNEYHFIEFDKIKAKNLEKQIPSNKNCTVHCGDMNILLPDLLRKRQGRGNRFLIFIDPYGLQPDFQTIEEIKNMKYFDILYLFNLQALARMMPLDRAMLKKGNENKLTAFLGGEAGWETAYKEKRQKSLFPNGSEIERQSNLSHTFLKQYKEKLDSLFPYSDVIYSIKTKGNEFALIFTMNYPNLRGTSLAKKFIRESKSIFKRASLEKH